ncbi:hypothetical protein Tco_1287452 [Tanacetum coccineum]
MTEPTMEEYMMKTQEDYGLGIARPKFDKDAKFELKGQFLKELCDHTFSGLENEDANEHIEIVLEIVDLFTIPDVTQDQLMLRVFPITLTGAVSRWLRNESAGLINTWEILKEIFLRKYCPFSRTFIEMSSTLLNEYVGSDFFYKGLDVPTRHILDSKGGVPKMSAADAKKAIQEMADYSQKWHDGNLLEVEEEGKTLEEAYYTQFGVPFSQARRYRKFELQRMLQLEKGFGSLPSSIETNPRDHVKSITTTEEAETLKEDDKMPLIEFSQGGIPFPDRLKENGYDEKEVLKELKKLKVNSTESATSLKIFLREKSRIEEEIKETMKVHRSEILKDALPPKEKDPRSFTLPCSINNICFDKALAGLGASVSVMPYSNFTNLGLGKLAPTKLIIELTDKTVKRPKGIAENVLVGIDKFVFPVDFIVLDMPEDRFH